MPKTKVVQLIQSPLERAEIVNIANDEQGIVTGQMGGCCSVVILWGKAPNTGLYMNCRGHHGSGGPGALDWDNLINGVQANVTNMLVMSCAPDDYSGYIDKVKEALKAKQIKMMNKFYNLTNAYIKRDGTVSDFSKETASNYTIRNQGRFIL